MARFRQPDQPAAPEPEPDDGLTWHDFIDRDEQLPAHHQANQLDPDSDEFREALGMHRVMRAKRRWQDYLRDRRTRG